jgi:activator of HSP90 ATPase
MKNGFKISAIIPTTPNKIYRGWLSTKGHTAMTGSAARVSRKIGGRFTAWDGYIFGRTLELEPDQHIVQAWRTSEFPAEAPDSRLEVFLEKVKNGTRVTLTHIGLPSGSAAAYKQGWKDFYFTPMKKYFEK